MYNKISKVMLTLATLLTFGSVYAEDFSCPPSGDIVVLDSGAPVLLVPWLAPQMPDSQGPGAGLGGKTVGKFMGAIESTDRTGWMCLYASSQHATLEEAYLHRHQIAEKYQSLIPHLAEVNATVGMVIYKKK